MFGSLANLIPSATPAEPPKDVPPPTPVNFPRCQPVAREHGTESQASSKPAQHLVALLQSIVRPTELSMTHLEALGVHVISNVTPADLIPDQSFIPEFRAWARLDADEAHAADQGTRRPLSNSNLSPGCQIYLERRRELSVANADAFRTVRRVPAPKGKSQARLGNSFEFFRYLDLFSTFWEDTSKANIPHAGQSRTEGGDVDTAIEKDAAASQKANVSVENPDEYKYYRSSAGHQMPAEYRQNITSAFLKLVAYDFGCNVSASRTEPRLYIACSVPSQQGHPPSKRRSSYFSSACTFVFRTPNTREAARSGIVEGPLAAVSARHTTSFPASGAAGPATTTLDSGTDKDSMIDLARELIAALVTAQHRARHGRTEQRIGLGEWWATKPRWGGGSGGPIGREVDLQANTVGSSGSTKESPASASGPVDTSADSYKRRSATRPPQIGTLLPPSSTGTKRLKRSGNLPMYDKYRMVRPPAAAWDPKAKYEAIGRARGKDYDDIFVVSTLFHHVSILRVRVPDRLMAVLDGAEEDGPERSWGRLEARRSRWHDLFKLDDRLAAMELVWSVMLYLMRKEEPADEREQDVNMSST